MDPSTEKTLRTFAAGAGCGFLAGAVLAVMLLAQAPGETPSKLERWMGGLDDAGEGIIAPHPPEAPVATTGTDPRAAKPTGSPEPVLTGVGAPDLSDRDLEIPVEGIDADDLVRSFTEARGGRQHEAIDIIAPRNTPVKAVEGGRIARLFYSKAGGITIYQFDPTEQFCYYYAHLERYADDLAEGQTVRKGQVLGYVGVSGNAPKDTPHLHFAIFRLTAAKRWWEGTPIDPFDVLR